MTPLAATPVQRIAVRDDFRSGLATHTDPRFLRPLTHQVDPTVGGLVDGLAAVGLPSVHDDGPDPAVPLQRAVKSAAPRVQRRVAWSGSDELTTVRWELPEMPVAAETTDVVPDHEPTIDPSGGAGGDRSESSVLGSSGFDSSLLGTPAAPDPLTALEQAGQAEHAGQAEQRDRSRRRARLGREFRSRRQLRSEPPRLPRPEGPATLQRTLASVEGPSPSVSTAVSVDPRVPARTDEIADVPVSGTGPDTGDAPLPGVISSDHDDAPAPTQSGAAASSVPAAETSPVVARTMAPSVRPVEPPTLEPTAGAHATPDLAARPEPPLESAASRRFTEVALPLAATRTIVPAAAQPMGAGVSDPVVEAVPAVPPASLSTSGGTASVQRSLHVGAAVRPPTASAALPTLPTLATVPEMTERPTSGSVAADSFLTTITLGAVSALESGRAGSTVGPADESAPTDSSSRAASAQRLVADSAVAPPSSASRLSSPGRPSTSPGAESVPAAGALTVGLPLVQRSSAAHESSVPAGEAPTSGSAKSFASMFSETSPSSVAATVSGPRAPTLAVATLQRQSFDDSSSAGTTDAAESLPATEPAPDGGAASETAEAPAPAAGTSSSAVAPPAAPAADVDEMARRLYEPLVARLRAELWLDRERAGVFGDG